MPRLDERLKCVARQIQSVTHVDVGSDHGHLLKALLAAGRIQTAIAIENKRQPLENSRTTLTGFSADVRFGNGLRPLQVGEADSMSICGMGGKSIVQILTEFPPRVPLRVVAQPNKRADLLRIWGLQTGFRLKDEMVADRQRHDVLVFEKPSRSETSSTQDPVYDGIDRDAAVLIGPWHIRRSEPSFIARLREEHLYLSRLPQLNRLGQRRLRALSVLLSVRVPRVLP